MKNGTVIQMSPRTMAFKPLTILLCAAMLLGRTYAWRSSALTDDFTPFIPSCARECFVAFLNSNFVGDPCENPGSLACVCTQTGASGFTAGEGAVQCLEAQKSVGFCDDDDASVRVIQQAYAMCRGQPSAVTPTNTALEATFVIPSGGGGVVLVPPRTATSSGSSSATSIAPSPPSSRTTTFVTSSRTEGGRSGSSSRESTATSSSSAADDVSTSEASPLPDADAEDDDSDSEPDPLGTAQVIGLSVGVAAAAGLLLLVCILARKKRKQRLAEKNRMSDFFSNHDSWDFHPDNPGNGGGGSGPIFHISPPLHGKSPSPTPGAFSRGSWRPEGIGVAVSRPRSDAQLTANNTTPSKYQRRVSRLLPPKPEPTPNPVASTPTPKPMLSLTIPKVNLDPTTIQYRQVVSGGRMGQIQTHQTDSQIHAAQIAQLTAPPPARNNVRDSTMTEFEEDGTTTHASVTVRAPSQIWRPPSSDPLSAGTYYVADKNGNWVLGDPTRTDQQAELAELEAPTPLSALSATGGGDAASKTRTKHPEATTASAVVAGKSTKAGQIKTAPPPPVPNDAPRAAAIGLMPPAQITASASDPMMSRASSVYSQSSIPRGNQAQPQTSATHNAPAMSFSHPEPPRRRSNSLGRKHSHTQGKIPGDGQLDRHDSQLSCRTTTTSIASSAFVEPDDTFEAQMLTPHAEQGNLSPVAESPRSPIGRSPVSYPRIPGRMNSTSLRLHPPPVRPHFALPPGQPSPTLGLMQPAPGTNQAGFRGPNMNVGPNINNMGPNINNMGPNINNMGPNVPERHPGRGRPGQNMPGPAMQRPPQQQMRRPPGAKGAVGYDPTQFRTGSPTVRMVPASRSPSGSPQPQTLRPQRTNTQTSPVVMQPPQMAAYEGVVVAAAAAAAPPNRNEQAQVSNQNQGGADWVPDIADEYQALVEDKSLMTGDNQGFQKQQYQQHHEQHEQESQQQQQQQQHQHQQQNNPQNSPQNYGHIAHQQRPPLPETKNSGSSTSFSSGSLSLAAKRIGSERAANLSLRSQSSTASRDGWRRQGGDDGDEELPLPGTPGWKPKLTPTRRGDDLFLDVQ